MDETSAFEERIIALLAESVPGKFKKARITRDMRLQRDLGLDSLATASLMFRLEGEFGLDLGAVTDLGALRSVGDLIDFAATIRPRP